MPKRSEVRLSPVAEGKNVVRFKVIFQITPPWISCHVEKPNHRAVWRSGAQRDLIVLGQMRTHTRLEVLLSPLFSRCPVAEFVYSCARQGVTLANEKHQNSSFSCRIDFNNHCDITQPPIMSIGKEMFESSSVDENIPRQANRLSLPSSP